MAYVVAEWSISAAAGCSSSLGVSNSLNSHPILSKATIMFRANSIPVAAVFAATLLVSGQAAAAPINVTFSATETYGGLVTGQLKLQISDAGPGQVTFKFTNVVGTASNVSEIYLSDGLLFGSNPTPTNVVQVGTNFDYPGADPGLPGGGITNWTNTSQFFSADAQGQSGITSASDSFSFNLALISSQTLDDVRNALNNQSGSGAVLRLALHVRSIGDFNDGSQWFLNKPPGPGPEFGSHNSVPEPASLALLALGSVGLGFTRLRRRKNVDHTAAV